MAALKLLKLGGDCCYSGNENRSFCSERGIETSFSQKGKKRETTTSVSTIKKELAHVRATAMEGSFGTQKEHYGLKRINGRTKKTEILIIFFGIHTANAVQSAKRTAEAELSQAA
ncbi:MAG: transposase [Bacteroidaceae bacterium]